MDTLWRTKALSITLILISCGLLQLKYVQETMRSKRGEKWTPFFFERRPLKVKSEMNLKNKQKIHWENEGRVGMEEHLSSAVGAQRKMYRNETAWGVLWLVICTAWEKFYCVELLMFASSTDLMVMVKLRRKWSSRIYSAQETCSSRVRRELL